MKTPKKIDLHKLHKNEYVTPKQPVLVQTSEATYLTITGQGEPGGPVFTEKIGALYSVAYTVKMTRKFAGQEDYGVCKLEAQYWCGQGGADFERVPRAEWCWRFLIRTPDFVTPEDLNKAVTALAKKGKSASAREVKLESLAEGLCVQMLHVGPYDREAETIARMRAYVEKEGLKFHGRHHEIYLSDPHRVPAERLKTILRIPVTR